MDFLFLTLIDTGTQSNELLWGSDTLFWGTNQLYW
jgi:hypothetical protein